MKLRPNQTYLKILIGILMPVFLFGPSLSFTASASAPIKIILSLNNPQTAPEVFARYHLSASQITTNSADPEFSALYTTMASSAQLTELAQDRDVRYAEPDQTMVSATIVTNDPYFTTLNDLSDAQWYLAKTHVPQAWDSTKGSSSVIVALVDTGVHASHIELNDGRIIAGFNTITNQPILAHADSDDNGHGTAVAGVIGAIPNNNIGIAGINWQVQIMPVKAIGADGTGDVSAVTAGIIWAADHGANIINLSLGGQGFGQDQSLLDAIRYAYNKGALIVAAAGNDLADQGINLDLSPVYPVCADDVFNMVLGVAATDVNDQKAPFSDYGSRCVDVSAPGQKILTTSYLPSNPSDNILIYGSGTSLAAPIVSGIAALFKAYDPNLSNVEIRDIIIKTADNIDVVNTTNCAGGPCAGLLGSGRINAYNFFAPKTIFDGALLRDVTTNEVYIIQGGIKRLVSPFVFSQRGFTNSTVTPDVSGQMKNYQLGAPILPLEGTLVKGQTDPTVYVINGDVKRPLTYVVFVSRHYSFADVQTLSDAEVASYTTGDWYWPPDSTMVVVSNDPTVYVMSNSVRRPITYFVFQNRKLSFANVISVTQDEFSHIPASPDPYWMPPLDGTLVKSQTDPAIYVIENGTKRLLSLQVFTTRNYKFANVHSLPQAEIDVIAPGNPIE